MKFTVATLLAAALATSTTCFAQIVNLNITSPLDHASFAPNSQVDLKVEFDRSIGGSAFSVSLFGCVTSVKSGLTRRINLCEDNSSYGADLAKTTFNVSSPGAPPPSTGLLQTITVTIPDYAGMGRAELVVTPYEYNPTAEVSVVLNITKS